MGVTRNSILFLTSLLCLSACDQAVQPITNLPSGASSVVIVPAIPDTAQVYNLGVTVFGNDLDEVKIDNWDLPSVIYGASEHVLEPRYKVSEVPSGTNPVDLGKLMYNNINEPSTAAIVAESAHLTAPPDLYVLLSPWQPPDVPTPYYLSGIGLTHTASPWLAPEQAPYVHTMMQVTIINGKTMGVLSITPLQMPPNAGGFPGGFLSAVVWLPAIQLKGFQWHNTWAEMTPDEQELVHTKIDNLLTMSVQFTLRTALASK